MRMRVRGSHGWIGGEIDGRLGILAHQVGTVHAMHDESRIKMTSNRYPKYRPDVDGLRGLAVLSVVGFHAFPAWVKGGFVGVDIFFAISGYIISSVIFNNIGEWRV